MVGTCQKAKRNNNIFHRWPHCKQHNMGEVRERRNGHKRMKRKDIVGVTYGSRRHTTETDSSSESEAAEDERGKKKKIRERTAKDGESNE